MTIASSHVRIAVSFLCMLVTVKGSQSHYRPRGCHRSRIGAHVRMNVVSYQRRELKDWGCGARPSAFERKCNSQRGGPGAAFAFCCMDAVLRVPAHRGWLDGGPRAITPIKGRTDADSSRRSPISVLHTQPTTP